jgi:hypothetical protein
MTDRSKHDVADRIAEWKARDEYIEELIAENHQQHTDNQRLGRDNAELLEMNAILVQRLDRWMGEARKLRAVRTRDWSGLLMLAYWKLTGRM